MPWYEEAVFYHIYPLGLTGAPQQNDYGTTVHRLNTLLPWIDHMKEMGVTGLYTGPLFESVGHGYETTDYRKLDSRLGTNEDLRAFVQECHAAGIRVILDGVFNHTGRDFFAFQDLKAHRENSRYLHWYCNVNFWGNNEYNDGFSYDNWGGYNLLVKLNLRNPEVRDYLLDTIRFWVQEFDIDGLRLDTADVLDFDFMRSLRDLADQVKADFWLMGEVIHGDYSRWVNERTLHSVTNYHLHKALYSGHNDHNYFEIAHTVKRQMDMGIGNGVKLYSFVDNHDVERIATKLRQKEHFLPVHVLMYTLPGIPSIYYGSEFGVEGRKERHSDASLRPQLDLEALLQAPNSYYPIVKALGRIHREEPSLCYGDYRELQLTTTKYAFARGDVIVTVNNDANPASFDLSMEGTWRGALFGNVIASQNGHLHLEIGGNSGEIWIPAERAREHAPEQTILQSQPVLAGEQQDIRCKEQRERVESTAASEHTLETQKSTESNFDASAPEKVAFEQKAVEQKSALQEAKPVITDTPGDTSRTKSYEEMTISELQQEILKKLASNGPVTDRMRREVAENVYLDSLLNWVRSFRN